MAYINKTSVSWKVFATSILFVSSYSFYLLQIWSKLGNILIDTYTTTYNWVHMFFHIILLFWKTYRMFCSKQFLLRYNNRSEFNGTRAQLNIKYFWLCSGGMLFSNCDSNIDLITFEVWASIECTKDNTRSFMAVHIWLAITWTSFSLIVRWKA